VAINYQALQFWLTALVFLVNVALWLYVRQSNKSKATTEALGVLAERLTKIETAIPFMPSRRDLDKLGAKIESLVEKLGTLDGRLSGINRAVDLLNQHHLKIGDGS
jgi:cbb3-type cytochrome oxidase subunit 3